MVKILHQQASPIWGAEIYENLVVSDCTSTTYSNNSILHRHEFKMNGKRFQKKAQTLIHGDLTGWKVEKTPFNTSNKKAQCGTPLKRDWLKTEQLTCYTRFLEYSMMYLENLSHFLIKSPLTSQHRPFQQNPKSLEWHLPLPANVI